MGFAVSEFKSNIASNGGGARPNLFKVKIEFNSIDELYLSKTTKLYWLKLHKFLAQLLLLSL